MYFLKLYNDLYYDAKVQKMPYRLRWRMIETFLAASIQDEGGLLPPLDEMAWHLHSDVEELESDFAYLATQGILYKSDKGWVVTNFEKRQGRIPAKERMAQMRARKRRKESKPNEQETSEMIGDEPVGELAGLNVAFLNASNLYERPIPKWVEALKTLKNMGATEDDIKEAMDIANEKGYTIVGPWSIINIVANLKRRPDTSKTETDPAQTATEVW